MGANVIWNGICLCESVRGSIGSHSVHFSRKCWVEPDRNCHGVEKQARHVGQRPRRDQREERDGERHEKRKRFAATFSDYLSFELGHRVRENDFED